MRIRTVLQCHAAKVSLDVSSAFYILQFTFSILDSTFYILHSTLYILHSAIYILQC